MNQKNTAGPVPSDARLVAWDEKYGTGIPRIDGQHKELIWMTNELYDACLQGGNAAGEVFRDSMRQMVAYVRGHFGAEETFMDRIGFPGANAHRKKHELLIRNILAAAKNYDGGQKYVPNHFVRLLRDWILTHIAVEDQQYVLHAQTLKARGIPIDDLMDNI